jgi:acetylornithine deacetylase/succinyl-diaminopimelate desuccinylase-like protein
VQLQPTPLYFLTPRLQGGVSSDGKTFQMNIVPGEFEAGFDIRIPPSVDLAQFKKQVHPS